MQISLLNKSEINQTKLMKKYIISLIQKYHDISFYDYMNICLYKKHIGYYNSKRNIIGRKYDFITMPEIFSVFSYCIVLSIIEYTKKYKYFSILEIGPGTGKMAVSILKYLISLGIEPKKYFLLEKSDYLILKQRYYIKKYYPFLYKKFIWINKNHNIPIIKEYLVILANELLDSFPVIRFIYKDKKFLEEYITYKNDDFFSIYKNIKNRKINKYLNNFVFSDNYISEISPDIYTWIKFINNIINKGIVIIIDYGFLDKEYYHPQRSSGTISCFFKHTSNSNPFLFPGIQDISSHVNFSLIINTIKKTNFLLEKFLSQGNFIIENMLKNNYILNSKFNNSIKFLTSPNEVGEIFKIMILKK